MTISSPELALLIAACIDSLGRTKNSPAIPVLEFNVKIKKATAKAINLFILIPPISFYIFLFFIKKENLNNKYYENNKLE